MVTVVRFQEKMSEMSKHIKLFKSVLDTILN